MGATRYIGARGMFYKTASVGLSATIVGELCTRQKNVILWEAQGNFPCQISRRFELCPLSAVAQRSSVHQLTKIYVHIP